MSKWKQFWRELFCKHEWITFRRYAFGPAEYWSKCTKCGLIVEGQELE